MFFLTAKKKAIFVFFTLVSVSFIVCLRQKEYMKNFIKNFASNFFTTSNILFTIAMAVVLYPPSRIWILRQMSFTPSIEKVNEKKVISNYNNELRGLNTADLNFSQFKGKVIFLNFWATWCPPCVAELPYIQALHNDYKDKVAFVFIANEKWSDIDSFFKEKGYDFPIYQYKKAPLKDLPTVNSIPRTFIIDKQGNIRVDKSGSADWNSTAFRAQMDTLLK